MSTSMLTPTIASRTTALSTETEPSDTGTPRKSAPETDGWTFGDYLIIGFSLLSLCFAAAGILIALR